jgi:Ca2+-binding RTX toxin-like protein
VPRSTLVRTIGSRIAATKPDKQQTNISTNQHTKEKQKMETYRGDAGNNYKKAEKTGFPFFKSWDSWQMYGEGGNDTLIGGEKNDTLDGGTGNDLLQGGDGNDLITESSDTRFSNNDTIYGGFGNDTIDGGVGADVIFADPGNDYAYGGTGNDIIWGWTGNDFLSGQDGDDQMNGQQDHDTLYGGNGNDVLYGDAGNDRLYGETNNDILNGGSGFDFLSGGSGNDTLIGVQASVGVGTNTQPNYGTGEQDTLNGGAGSDLFVLGNSQKVYYHSALGRDELSNGRLVSGADYAIIQDFRGSEGDKIKLNGRATDYRLEYITHVGSSNLTDTVILYRNSNEVIGVLQDVNLTGSNGLSSSNFVYG